MTIQQLQMTAPPLAALVLALALLFTLAALRQFSKSRTDSYWRRRREAGQRGWRLLVTSVFLMLTSGMVCSISGVAGLVLRAQITPTAIVIVPTQTAVPTLSPTPLPTLTPTIFVPTSAPLATDPPTETSTPLPTATLTPSLTLTPRDTATALSTNTPVTRLPVFTTISEPTVTIPTPTPSTPTPKSAAALVLPSLQSSVTPASNARLTITALDHQISGTLGPVNPATVFAPGFTRLYYFVNFANMQSGVVWRGVLILNGSIIQRYERLWGTAQNGSGYFFFGQENGFQAGSYEIWLYLGDTPNPIATAAFRVESK